MFLNFFFLNLFFEFFFLFSKVRCPGRKMSGFRTVRILTISRTSGPDVMSGWALFVRQPDNHIGWAHPRPLHQFILLTQGSISKIWLKKYLELVGLNQWHFLNPPNPKFRNPEIQNLIFFLSSPLKSVTNYGVAWMGLNFYHTKNKTTFSPMPNNMHPIVNTKAKLF